jgi:hypothetical protein
MRHGLFIDFLMLELIPNLVSASQLLEFPGRGFPECPAVSGSKKYRLACPNEFIHIYPRAIHEMI